MRWVFGVVVMLLGSGALAFAGTYKGMCDGSAAVAADASHFLNFGDESHNVSVYEQGSAGSYLQSQNLGGELGLGSKDEADIEDAARVGNRVYVVTSHGRNKNGKLEASRYRFFALDITGAVPAITFSLGGTYEELLQDFFDAANWVVPNAGVIAAVKNASKLGTSIEPNLAPKINGTSIEGLAALGDSGVLVLGFRNPHPGAALVVTFLNADAVLAGATARFGQAIAMDLEGNGIRGMAWSEMHQAVFIVSGPSDGGDGPFALWRWSGDPACAPSRIQTLVVPSGAHPEAIIPSAGTNEIRILLDQGAAQIDGQDCKDVPAAKQFFTDLVVNVP